MKEIINISLHLAGLSFMLRDMAKLWISEAVNDIEKTLRKLIEFLGIISKAVVSATNLIRRCQSDRSLFVMTVKKITPSFVPWGTPSFRVRPLLTTCRLLDRKVAIHFKNTGWTSSLASSRIKIAWSIRSNPFVKSGKNSRAEALPQSTAS